MSEWVSVLAVFWALWALDGLKLLRRAGFMIVGGGGRATRARVGYARLSLPGMLPTSWRMNAADIPLTLSPVGISNHPAGSAGRPAETPPIVRAWRWEEIREVGVARGWIFINGERFCADTGHVRASELLQLAGMAASAREKRIETLLRLCFRPAHLRRRAHALKCRTELTAQLNTITVAAFVGLTLYVAGDVASRLPARWSERMGEILPWLLLGVLTLHVAAVIAAGSARRHIRVRAPDKRGSALFSAALLPPQALRLRSLIGDGSFPPSHPLAAVLAFGDRATQETYAFHVIADLRWPMHAPQEALPSEIARWYRERVETLVRTQLTAAGIATEALLQAPAADSPVSRSYCPRCRDQFVEARGTCPNGVTLCPLAAAPPAVRRQA